MLSRGRGGEGAKRQVDSELGCFLGCCAMTGRWIQPILEVVDNASGELGVHCCHVFLAQGIKLNALGTAVQIRAKHM